MAITGIQSINNLSPYVFTFTNTEQSALRIVVPSYNCTNANNTWIPWCDNANQFSQHHLLLSSSFKEISIVIWQSGNNILYSLGNTYKDNANANVLYSKVGLSVDLLIEANGESLTMLP